MSGTRLGSVDGGTSTALCDVEQLPWLDGVDDPRRGARARLSPLLALDDEITWDVPARARRRSGHRPSAVAPAWAGRITGRDRLAEPVATPVVVSVEPVATERPPDRHALVVPGADESPASDRRTVVITGHGSERYLPARTAGSRGLRRHERSGFQPDRVAMYAFLLGIALLLGAVTSSHAATLVAHAAR